MSIDRKILNKLHYSIENNWWLRHLAIFCASHLVWLMLGVAIGIRYYVPDFAEIVIGFDGIPDTIRDVCGLCLEYLAIIVLVPLLISLGISKIVKRHRPTLPRRHHPFIDLFVNTYSFPSSHTTIAFALSVAVIHDSTFVYFLIGAILVGLGRLAVGVHYLSDVIVGAVVGLLFGYAAYIGMDLIPLLL